MRNVMVIHSNFVVLFIKILFHFDTHYLNINLGLCEFNVGFLLIKIRFNVSIHGEGVLFFLYTNIKKSIRKETLRKHLLEGWQRYIIFYFEGLLFIDFV